MTAATDSLTLRQDLLNAVFKGIDYTSPELYLALYTTDSSTEVDADRTPIGSVDWDLVTASPDCHIENNDEVVVTEVPASTIDGAMLFDAVTGGNLLLSADFTGGSVVVPEGDSVVFAAGELVFSLDHA